MRTAAKATDAAVLHVTASEGRVTLEVTKQQLRSRAAVVEQTPEGEEALLREVYGGPDFAEGVRAFLAKEKPRFGEAP